MINLAINAENLAKLRAANISLSDVMHYTSHQKYNNYVTDQLEFQFRTWRSSGQLPADIKKATAIDLQRFVDAFDLNMRASFFQEIQNLRNLLRSDGSLSALPTTAQGSET